MKKRQYVIGAVVLAVVFLGYSLLSGLYSDWKEQILLRTYKQDARFRAFTDMIDVNKRDLANKPDDAKRIAATMDMGLEWYNLNEFKLAIKWWKRGLDLYPKSSLAWYNIGNAYLALKKYTKAEEAYRQSMENARPGEIESCLALGEMYKSAYTKKKDEEDDVYLECLDKHEDNRDIIARLAVYYRDSGDKKNALKYFDKLFFLDPNSGAGEEIRRLQSTTE